MFGQDPLSGTPGGAGLEAPKKIFVGSLPDGIQELSLHAEFGKFGNIQEVYLKQGCQPGRQWAFITYASPEEAAFACESTNNILMFAGAVKTCEVTLARNQGMYGQGQMGSPGQAPAQGQGGFWGPQAGQGAQGYSGYAQAAPNPTVPRKIFVGSLPDYATDELLRAEFGKFGQISDIFVKQGCEPGRQWAFVTFSTPESAQIAKDSCDRILMFPGAQKACEVTLAKNQGMFGQDPMNGAGAPAKHGQAVQPFAGAPEQPRKIFVGSLPDGITDADLRAEFSRYGHVVDLYLKI